MILDRETELRRIGNLVAKLGHEEYVLTKRIRKNRAKPERTERRCQRLEHVSAKLKHYRRVHERLNGSSVPAGAGVA